MRSGKPCIDCRTLIDSPVANEPHVSLKTYAVSVLPEGRVAYYECRACGSNLLREQNKHDPDARWLLVF
jgi:hypothetical protein